MMCWLFYTAQSNDKITYITALIHTLYTLNLPFINDGYYEVLPKHEWITCMSYVEDSPSYLEHSKLPGIESVCIVHFSIH